MLARDAYRATLCTGCGQPKEQAWHPDNDGWFEVTQSFTCNGCTALAREGNADAEPVKFHAISYTRPDDNPLPPMPVGPRMSPDELAEALNDAGGGAE